MKITFYTLAHPVTKEIRYVGRTQNILRIRLNGHTSEGMKSKTYRGNWIRSLAKEGLKPIIEEIETIEASWDESHLIEKYWIYQFTAWNFRLVNSTDKGAGRSKAFDHIRQSVIKTVYQYTKEGKLIGQYESAREAEKQTGVGHKLISACCTGKRLSAHGFLWSFESRTDLKWARPKNRPYTSKGKRTVYQYDWKGKLLGTWNKVKDAANDTGVSRANIEKCANNNSKTAGGFKWTYEPINLTMEEKKKKVVAILDGDILVYRIAAVLEDENEWAIVKFEIDQYLLNKILRPIDVTHYMGFLTGHKNFRKELTKVEGDVVEQICKPYKGGRSDIRPFWFLDVRKYLVDVWGFVEVHGMEADDAIAICQRKNSYICSNDHDFDTIPGWHWNFASNTLKEPYWVSAEQANYNFWLQMLTGCNTDEVEGLPGIGPKKGADLLATTSEDYYPEFVKSLYLACNKWKEDIREKKFDMTYKLLRLRRHTDAEYESYKFTIPALREVPVGRNNPKTEEEEDEF